MISKVVDIRVPRPGFETSDGRVMTEREYFRQCKRLLDDEARAYPSFAVTMHISEDRVTHFTYMAKKIHAERKRAREEIGAIMLKDGVRRIARTFGLRVPKF